MYHASLRVPLGRAGKATLCLLALLSVTNMFCTYIPQENLEALDAAGRFIEAIEKNQPQVALALLTQDVQARIDYEQLSVTDGDFEGIVKAFRQAGITTRSKDEPSLYVSNLRGQEGDLLFVVVKENEEWKIANILERH